MPRFLRSFSVLLLSLFTLNLTAPPASALTVSPVKLELSGDPGQTISGTFDLINEQDATLDFFVSFSNFEAEGESGSPKFVDSGEGLATWIRLLPEDLNSVTLGAGEKQSISYEISIPQDATPGGHFAAIFWGTNPESLEEEKGLALGAKVGILVLLTVKGDISQEGGLLEFDTVDSQRVFSELPVGFYYRFQNNGGDRVIPTGTMKISNVFGLQKAELPLNAGQSNVLPSSVRRFEEMWGSLPTEADRSFWEYVEDQWKNFAFGYYKVNVDLSYGNDGGTDHEELGLWLLPWQLLSVLGGALFLLLVLGRFLIKRYNRWIISKALSKPTPRKKKRS